MKPYAALVLLTLSLVIGACSSLSEEAVPLTSWSFEGTAHDVRSGIAGYVPDLWVERGWDGDGIIVYLSDQALTCEQFPRTVSDVFSPLPTETGAMIWMKFEETERGSALDHSSFEIIEVSPGGGISGNGASTSDVEAAITAFDPTDTKRVTGQISYDSREFAASPEILVNGSFDATFCP
jgi:hypothetical protein